MSLAFFDRAFWQNLYEAVSARVVSFSPTPVVYAIVDSVPHVYLLMLWIVGITTIVSFGRCLLMYDCLSLDASDVLRCMCWFAICVVWPLEVVTV